MFLIGGSGQIYACGQSSSLSGLGISTDAIAPTLVIYTYQYPASGLALSTSKSWMISGDQIFYFGGEDSYFGPQALFSLTGNTKQIADGDWFSLYLTKNGTVYGVGQNLFGNLGFGNTNDAAYPTIIPSLPFIDRITASPNSPNSFFVTPTGVVYGAGGNTNSMLGLNAFSQISTPQIITALVGQQIVDVCTGSSHTIYLTSTGQVWGAGYSSVSITSLTHRRDNLVWVRPFRLPTQRLW
jgi:hypothetical protein